jgi:hypothetical protein
MHKCKYTDPALDRHELKDINKWNKQMISNRQYTSYLPIINHIQIRKPYAYI